jgi:hypothetical protein
MDEELSGIEFIQADEKLTPEAKALAVDAAALDTVETAEELKDGEGVITFEALCARMKADDPDAQDADIEAATIAWWIF